MDIIHYGLQRSGTNYLESVLTAFFRASFINKEQDRSSPLHKHFRPYKEKHLIPTSEYRNDMVVCSYAEFERSLGTCPAAVLVISKDPWSWFLSYSRWARKCGWPPPAHHYIEEYNLFYRTWLQFSRESDKVTLLRYRDLLADPRGIADEVARKFNLKRRFFPRSGFGKVPQSAGFTMEQKDAYLRRDYMKDFSGGTLEEVNRRIDADLLRALGYNPTA